MRLTGDQKKSKKNSEIFHFFPHAGNVEENTCHFEVLLLFLSLGYGADLGRSRPVSMRIAINLSKQKIPINLSIEKRLKINLG